MKKTISILTLILIAQVLYAGVDFRGTAPNIVEVNEQFRLSYTINTQDIKDFRLAEMSEFEVDMGPSKSSQSSIQYINGKMSKNSSITLTYILRATKEGDFTIPPAMVVVDGEEYKSNSIQIKVLKATTSSSSTQSGPATRMRTQDAGTRITDRDLFIKATVSKKQVYEQEAILLTYKVYSLVSLSQLNGGIPQLDGFHTQEIELPQQKSFKMEQYDGKTYGTVIWRQYVLFPQKSGELKIPKVEFEALVLQQMRNIDPFEAFFNGGSAISEVRKKIVAPEITLNVKELPTTSMDFSGAVGQFSIKSNITTTQLKANDALTLKISVSGNGNMKLMKAPTVHFPTDFETYDAKISDKTRIGKEGAVGEKIFEYLAVPRHAGTYNIPEVEFCYFDTKEKSYKTLKTEAYSIKVDQSEIVNSNSNINYTRKEDVKLLASDIHYIHLGDVNMKKSSQHLYGSFMYVMYYIISLLIFLIIIIIYRKRAKENANHAKQRNKKANKVAIKRLKTAAILLKQNKKESYYDEVLKALWGYVADKLNIPTAQLNKDIVAEQLENAGIPTTDIKKLLDVMNECEFARFSSASGSEENMKIVYSSATEAINAIENYI